MDDYLNDVRLFLSYFNMDTVKTVIDELQNTEGGEIPTVIDGESMERPIYAPWTVHSTRRGPEVPIQGQMEFGTNGGQTDTTESNSGPGLHQQEPEEAMDSSVGVTGGVTGDENLQENPIHPQSEPTPLYPVPKWGFEEKILSPAKRQKKSAKPAAMRISLVAGIGFEPMTFGL